MADGSKAADSPDLSAEIATLRKEIEALAGTVSRIGRAGAATARGAAEGRIHEGAEAIGGVEEKILAQTRDHPWRVLGLAALGGLVLGLVLRR
ncbi:hypothetical protein [Solirhodobacter olei]|uniref:hypothetical protein n=1 Tax=Solirhodobacter olei TaxID=2493082 RepID=UPI000FDC9BB9|nr:hypothetical protein [Solirhodobacter olei]